MMLAGLLGTGLRHSHYVLHSVTGIFGVAAAIAVLCTLFFVPYGAYVLITKSWKLKRLERTYLILTAVLVYSQWRCFLQQSGALTTGTTGMPAIAVS